MMQSACIRHHEIAGEASSDAAKNMDNHKTRLTRPKKNQRIIDKL
jgi:hypothetical protein